jgi:enoyl-CoA hydratase/carnithine racemase
MNPDTTRSLVFEQQGYIGTITLCRPDTLNSIDNEAHDELHCALESVRSNSELRVLVIAAKGRCFSAGGDFEFMRQMNRDPELNSRMASRATGMIELLANIDVPVITAVQGDAIGFGASLAFAGDIVVASRTARFADPHVLVGLAAGDGGCLFWPQAAGLNRAKRYVLTGDYISAEKAYEFGLVTDLTDSPEDARTLSDQLAKKVAGLAPLAVQGTKRSFNNLTKARIAEVAGLAALFEQQTMASEDLLEALAAMEQKRKPDFKNR